jgi:hypothetical protein
LSASRSVAASESAAVRTSRSPSAVRVSRRAAASTLP